MAERAWWRGLVVGAAGGALVAGLVAPGGVGALASPRPPSLTVRVNGRVIALAQPALLFAGQPYLPVVDLAQVLGVAVSWDAHHRVVSIGEGTTTPLHTFTFQGIQYSATDLQVRSYPSPHSTSGTYWIVQYALTNTTQHPINVGSTQPALRLLGPNGAQFSPDPTLSGPTAGTLNPQITFSSYLVFNLPDGANPALYRLGFNAYRVTAAGFTTTTLSAALPTPTSRTKRVQVNLPYAVSGLWNADVQSLLVRQIVETNAIVPDLTAASFDPKVQFWVVEFGVDNPGPETIHFSASDFALQFGSGLAIAPYQVSSLPGYVPPSNLQSSAGVTLAPGEVFNGALLFAVPGGTPTANPQLAITVNGQERVIPAGPCSGSACTATAG